MSCAHWIAVAGVCSLLEGVALGVALNAKKEDVAVLLATYNGESYLSEFLDSLAAQTYQGFKVFVRDDGSSDNTMGILATYSAKLHIEVLSSSFRMGPAKSFFELLRCAEGAYEFYFFADQDDRWHEEKISRGVASLSKHLDEVALYCTRMEYVDQNLAHLKYSKVPRYLTLENAAVQNIATGCTVAITKSVRNLTLNAMPNAVIMHDWWLYMVATTFGQVVYDPFPSIKYRQHQSNTIGAATHWIEDVRRRASRFIKRDGGVFGLSWQVAEFLRCFSGRLTDSQAALLGTIVVGKVDFLARSKLAFFSPFRRQSLFDTLILRCLFLLNRY